MAGEYRPEIDTSPELDANQQNYYKGLIGILRWICKLGRLDIVMSVSLLPSYLAQARVRHLNQVFHMFAYLQHYGRSKLVFDTAIPNISEGQYMKRDWSELYPEAKEVIPPDTPEPLGVPVAMGYFVDANHARCKATKRSHTGVIIFLNNNPIL